MPDTFQRSSQASLDQHPQPSDLRNYLLAQNRAACVHRELWNNGQCTYLGLRSYIQAQRARGHGDASAFGAGHRRSISSVHSKAPSTAHSKRPSNADGVSFEPALTISSTGTVGTSSQLQYQPSAAYVFVDMLAYGDVDGNLWLIRNLQAQDTAPIKAPSVHRRPITALDWSPDNTYLLTASLDGLTVWDVSALAPIRTIMTPVASSAVTAAVFHCLSSNLVITGNASGMVDVVNISTGGHSLNSVPAYRKSQKGLEVTVVEVSAHHVYVGDNQGWLHLHKQEIPRAGQLAKLTHASRAHVSESGSPLIGCCYLAFCQAAAAPALLVTARDSTIAIVKIAKEHILEVFTRCSVSPPMARDIRAVPCPLSVLHCDLPRVVMGSEDTGVHIYNLSALRAAVPTGKAGHSAAPGRPHLVNTLRGHRAPVAAVSWAFDESFLASADCEGTVICWERAATV